MHESHGKLLIGGMRLDHVSVELEQEELLPGSGDWLLAGHLHCTSRDATHLQLRRRYLLHLEDGREGLTDRVAVARSDPAAPRSIEA